MTIARLRARVFQSRQGQRRIVDLAFRAAVSTIALVQQATAPTMPNKIVPVLQLRMQTRDNENYQLGVQRIPHCVSKNPLSSQVVFEHVRTLRIQTW